MRMTIVALAACVFPLGVVYAQDFEAIQGRLGSAVIAGELSEEQAHVMLDALRPSSRPCLESPIQRLVPCHDQLGN